ncbi:Proteophosphoglycan 5 [Rhodotorula toruloides]|nr:Proteophosphoglycan 5 [Rhodotorula toruloides]
MAQQSLSIPAQPNSAHPAQQLARQSPLPAPDPHAQIRRLRTLLEQRKAGASSTSVQHSQPALRDSASRPNWIADDTLEVALDGLAPPYDAEILEESNASSAPAGEAEKPAEDADRSTATKPPFKPSPSSSSSISPFDSLARISSAVPV